MRFVRTAAIAAALCAALCVATGAALAQAAPAPASSIMEKAYRQAKAARKPVLLLFGATW